MKGTGYEELGVCEVVKHLYWIQASGRAFSVVDKLYEYFYVVPKEKPLRVWLADKDFCIKRWVSDKPVVYTIDREEAEVPLKGDDITGWLVNDQGLVMAVVTGSGDDEEIYAVGASHGQLILNLCPGLKAHHFKRWRRLSE